MIKTLLVTGMLLSTTPAFAGSFWEKFLGIDQSQSENVKAMNKFARIIKGNNDLVAQVAHKHGMNPAVVHAIVKMESSGRCGADNGIAHGIMQVKTATARSVGVYGNLHDCRTGLEAGVRYLKKAIAMHGNTCAAYSSFNMGIGSSKCTAYGRKVMYLARL